MMVQVVAEPDDDEAEAVVVDGVEPEPDPDPEVEAEGVVEFELLQPPPHPRVKSCATMMIQTAILKSLEFIKLPPFQIKITSPYSESASWTAQVYFLIP